LASDEDGIEPKVGVLVGELFLFFLVSVLSSSSRFDPPMLKVVLVEAIFDSALLLAPENEKPPLAPIGFDTSDCPLILVAFEEMEPNEMLGTSFFSSFGAPSTSFLSSTTLLLAGIDPNVNEDFCVLVSLDDDVPPKLNF